MSQSCLLSAYSQLVHGSVGWKEGVCQQIEIKARSRKFGGLFDFVFPGGHPESPAFLQGAEGPREHRLNSTRDPSLRLKNGFTRDDVSCWDTGSIDSETASSSKPKPNSETQKHRVMVFDYMFSGRRIFSLASFSDSKVPFSIALQLTINATESAIYGQPITNFVAFSVHS